MNFAAVWRMEGAKGETVQKATVGTQMSGDGSWKSGDSTGD